MAMEHRPLGCTGLEVGVVGLGTEHLDRAPEALDAVLGVGIERGMNYVDMLYTDHDYWAANGPVYRAHRESLVAAVHWGPERDMDESQRRLDNILRHLGNDRAEIVLLTVVDDRQTWTDWALPSMDRLRPYVESGRVGAIGLSGHAPPFVREFVCSGAIDVLMFPVNMISTSHRDQAAVVEACRQEGVGLVAMKVYHGGTLLRLDGRPTGITPSQCLAYTLSLPVATTVPGPKTADEYRATLAYLDATEEERAYAPIVADIYHRFAGHCTYCHHCLPCPQEIEVGFVLWYVDQASGGVTEELRQQYRDFPGTHPEKCVECGVCVERCPFGVDIMAKLGNALRLFGTH